MSTAIELRRHNQRDILKLYLRLVPLEDAGALGTTRPSLTAPRGPRAVPWATYEDRVDNKLTHFPPELIRFAPAILAALPWHQREVLRLCLSEDQPQSQVATSFRRSPRWVRTQQALGLTAVCCALWDDRGRVRLRQAQERPLRGSVQTRAGGVG